MNLNNHAEHSASPEDPVNAEDSVNYLRRLKGTLAATLPPDPAAQPETVSQNLTLKERRGSPRYRCSGSAEFRTEANTGRIWGTLTDISLHGCYLEMNTTFPIDTKVELVLKSCGIQIKANGIVRASYPALGMGIRFSRIDPENQSQLQKLLAHFNGLASAPLSVPTDGDADLEEAAIRNALTSADPTSFLAEIRDFFRKNRLLSKDEFHRMAKRVRRI